MVDILIGYIDKSSAITIFVLVWLSIYLILTIWIYLYRNATINNRIKIETHSLKKLYMGRTKTVDDKSLLFLYLSKVLIPNQAIFSAAKNSAIKGATSG